MMASLSDSWRTARAGGNGLQSAFTMLEQLKKEVLAANLELIRRGLVIYTFGNASGIDREQNLVAIKPSGVAFDDLKPEHMVVTDLDGKIVEGNLRPSSDLATHLELYRAFPTIGGVVHTHSKYATAWAQAGREIPCFGTTHADYFHGCVPVTGQLSAPDIESEYEANTGKAIVRRFEGIDPLSVPAVLVLGHGPFCWGNNPVNAAQNAVLLEEIAQTAYLTVTINQAAGPIPAALHDKHFLRKHGVGAYYGQRTA
jgi:L-ribulose-5-phosphate 4-epimerase